MSQSTSHTTTNHNEIRRWVEERGGHPARVKGTEKGKTAGVLRIDYPGFSGEDRLEEITWEEFFAGGETSEETEETTQLETDLLDQYDWLEAFLMACASSRIA